MVKEVLSYSEEFEKEIENFSDENEEMISYAEEIVEEMRDKEVGHGDLALIEKGEDKYYEFAVVGELMDIPSLLPTMWLGVDSEYRRNVAIYIPLKNEKCIRESEGGYKYETPDFERPPNTLIYRDHNLEFKDSARTRLEEKYGLSF